MLEIALLGQFAVLHDGSRLSILTRNAQSLFAYLLLNAGKAQRRERLAGILWPDSSEDNARSNLRHELWRLRKALKPAGDSYFIIDDLTIAFNPQSEHCLDVHRLESAAHEASSADDLMEALSVYHGELLPGFYDEWVFVERQRLHALFEAQMRRLLEILQVEGRWVEVLEWGMRWIGVGQWPEPAYRALMTAYANSGDISKAVLTYERFSQGLQEEIGTKPSEQTQALYKRIKSGWKANAPSQGEHTATSSMAKSPPAAPLPRPRRSNLPRSLTSFIGREKEIQQVEHLILGSRLVTITGPGGMGKTRLSIQASEVLWTEFLDGVWWVELASLSLIPTADNHDGSQEALSGADAVAQAIVKSLRIPDTPGLALLDGLVEHLYDKKLLLVLDNCEHLIAACAVLVERLLSDCPQVRILTTSREPLGVPGEKAWYLSSLSLPVAGAAAEFSSIVQSEAVCLFIERTADLLPGYQPGEAELQTIAQICLRLDGIPLAIELAAARMSLLSAREIAARLDSRFNLLTAGHRTALPRHQTLQAAIEWSYALLNALEQLLFRRLSVFAGSFTLEAAEAVCAGEDIQRQDVLTLLGRLVDKSLLNVDPSLKDADLATRYRFLDTISSFGHLKLEEAGETSLIRSRHAAYYIHLVKTAEPELLSKNQMVWHHLLRMENDNLRAAIHWSSESGQPENALRYVGALMWFWFRNGSNREGRDLVLKALEAPSGIQYKQERARALNTAGFLLCLLGDTISARRYLEEALSILRTSSDKINLAWSLQYLGLVFSQEKEYNLADKAFQEGLAIMQEIGTANTPSFLFFHGDVDLQKGNRSRAEKSYKESVHVFQALNNKGFAAYPLRRLGYMALEQNDLTHATKYFMESLQLNHESDDLPGMTASLVSLTALAVHLELPFVAARLLGAAQSRLDALSISFLYLDQVEMERVHSQLIGSLQHDEDIRDAFADGWNMSEDQVLDLVDQTFKIYG
jgi:predicted ATPase/DNA-binding SARP family transcriptional activator